MQFHWGLIKMSVIDSFVRFNYREKCYIYASHSGVALPRDFLTPPSVEQTTTRNFSLTPLIILQFLIAVPDLSKQFSCRSRRTEIKRNADFAASVVTGIEQICRLKHGFSANFIVLIVWSYIYILYLTSKCEQIPSSRFRQVLSTTIFENGCRRYFLFEYWSMTTML